MVGRRDFWTVGRAAGRKRRSSGAAISWKRGNCRARRITRRAVKALTMGMLGNTDVMSGGGGPSRYTVFWRVRKGGWRTAGVVDRDVGDWRTVKIKWDRRRRCSPGMSNGTNQTVRPSCVRYLNQNDQILKHKLSL